MVANRKIIKKYYCDLVDNESQFEFLIYLSKGNVSIHPCKDYPFTYIYSRSIHVYEF